MSDGPAPRSRRAMPTGVLLPAVLVAIRVLVLVLVLVAAGRGTVTDPVVLRAQRVASSPATPYRAFPVGTMPIETAVDRVLAAGGAGAAAARIAIVAFLADLGTAWAL